MKTYTRLIVNHGGESVLESNIAIHPYYGFPIIPGSAIKGVTRHYCEEFKELNTQTIIEIFGHHPKGSLEKEGGIVFMDAWPSSFNDINSFELDVMTPHYKDYYAEKSEPKDTISPEPHLFLCIKKDIYFEFSIRPSSILKDNKKDKLLEETKQLIIEALSSFGIGAKTGSNYGYFKIMEDNDVKKNNPYNMRNKPS
jgi:CRISPR-associated protein Cmr6